MLLHLVYVWYCFTVFLGRTNQPPDPTQATSRSPPLLGLRIYNRWWIFNYFQGYQVNNNLINILKKKNIVPVLWTEEALRKWWEWSKQSASFEQISKPHLSRRVGFFPLQPFWDSQLYNFQFLVPTVVEISLR